MRRTREMRDSPVAVIIQMVRKGIKVISIHATYPI